MNYLKVFYQWLLFSYTDSPLPSAMPRHSEKYVIKDNLMAPALITKNLLQSLKTFCTSPIKDFDNLRKLGFVKRTAANGLSHWFLDRGSKILAVAHLDFVQGKEKFGYYFDKDGREVILSPQLDDRLGVWIICDLLFNLGHDILLTEGEESGESTAQHFKAPRDYKWVFEFDRRGTDVVCYQFDSPQMKNLLEAFDFDHGYGSFSDIAYLERLGVKCFNFGCGYYNNHSVNAFAIMDELAIQIGKFLIFFNQMKEKKLWHRNTYKWEEKEARKKAWKTTTVYTPNQNGVAKYLLSAYEKEKQKTYNQKQEVNLEEEDFNDRRSYGTQWPEDDQSENSAFNDNHPLNRHDIN